MDDTRTAPPPEAARSSTEQRDWSREPKVLGVRIHAERSMRRALAVDVSRSGVQLVLIDPEFTFTRAEGDLGLVGLRVASQFGGVFRVEFLAAEVILECELARLSERVEGDEYVVSIGCHFLCELTDEQCARLEIASVSAPEPARPAPAQETTGDVEKVAVAAVPAGAVVMPTDVRRMKRRPADKVRAGPVRVNEAGGAVTIHDLLRKAVERRATDLHIKAGSPVRIRVDGHMRDLGDRILTAADADTFARALLDAEQFDRFYESGDLDLAFSLEGAGRFRVNVLRTKGDTGMAIRRIPEEVPSIQELGLNPVCLELAARPRGLVLVTGPTGSGKSTTLAAMVHHINERRACHIVTMEDPIEYLHREVRAHVTQREVGRDTEDFASALKRAMRQDPDVILVGEMRDLETIAMAVRAAETGHLVLATLHTTSATLTVDRIVDVFPPLQQRQIRMQLADCLQAIISQILVPRRAGGLVVAQEILVANDGIRALIRDGKTPQITNMMQTGAKEGMTTLEDSLNDLVQRGVISWEAAIARANQPSVVKVPPGHRKNKMNAQ